MCVCVCGSVVLERRRGREKKRKRQQGTLGREKEDEGKQQQGQRARSQSVIGMYTSPHTQLWDMLFGANVLCALICVHGVYIWRETHRYEQTGTDVILISLSLSLCVCISISVSTLCGVREYIYQSHTYILRSVANVCYTLHTYAHRTC